MEILIGLTILASTVAVAFVLPIVSYVRAARAERNTHALAADLAALRLVVEALRHPSGAPRAVDAAGVAAETLSTETLRAETLNVETLGDGTASAETPSPVAPDLDTPEATSWDAPPAGPPTTPAVAPLHTAPHESLEQRIGARWLLYVGIAALILGISYFIKFAFDNGWVSEPLRVAIGLGAGLALVIGGLRFVRQGLPLFGHVLTGGGIVVLYLALFAALHVYELIGATTAFGAMALVTAASAWLAHRQSAQVLALLAVIGGFATPVLVGGDRDAQVVLFTYVGILLAGTTLLAIRHTWPWLHLVSYLLTGLTVFAWATVHYTPAVWLRTILFLTVFAAMFGYLLLTLRRQTNPSIPTRLVSWVLLSAPLAYHVAAILILVPHPGPLLVYLVLFTVAGLSVSHHANAPWLRSVVLALVALPLMGWMSGLRRPSWYAGAIVTACAIYGLHLAGQWRAMTDDDAPGDVSVAEAVHAHLTGLFLPVALYMFFEARFSWWNPPMLTALACWNAAVAAVTWPRVQPLAWQYAALAATLSAVAIGVWFDGPAVAVGWALEGAALAWFARSRNSHWLGAGSAVLFLLGAVRLLEMLGQGLPLGSRAVLNTRTLAAVFVIGAAAWVARLLRTAEAPQTRLWRDVLVVGAHVLTVAWISAEIQAVFGQQAYLASADGVPVGVARAQLASQVALSVAWALYAVVLVAVGMIRQYAPARYLAIVLFALTVLKVVTQDIAQLDRVYQMLSVLGVGTLLVLASYMYQRMQRTQ